MEMYDLTAMGELLIDFTQLSTDGEGYPTLAAHPGGISSIPTEAEVLAALEE